MSDKSSRRECVNEGGCYVSQEDPGLSPGQPTELARLRTAVSLGSSSTLSTTLGDVEQVSENALQEIIGRMRLRQKKNEEFGFESKEELEAFLVALPGKISEQTREAIIRLKQREEVRINKKGKVKGSFLVFVKFQGRIYLTETAPSSRGAYGEEGGGRGLVFEDSGQVGQRSVPALLRQLDPQGTLQLRLPCMGMITSGLFTAQGLHDDTNWMLHEWVTATPEYPANPGEAWMVNVKTGDDTYCQQKNSKISEDSLPYTRGARFMRDVTDEMSLTRKSSALTNSAQSSLLHPGDAATLRG